MYIIFNKEGEETLRYFLNDLPEELKKQDHVKIDEGDIPEKDGHVERAKLIDGKLEWEFKEITKPINPEEEILERKDYDYKKYKKI